MDRLVGAVGSGQLPERGEFGRLAEADFKHNVFKKSNSVGKIYSSSKKGPMNRFNKLVVDDMSCTCRTSSKCDVQWL